MRQKYKRVVVSVISNRKTQQGLKLCYCEYLRRNYKIGRSPSENPLGIKIRKQATQGIGGIEDEVVGIHFTCPFYAPIKEYSMVFGNGAPHIDCILKDRRDHERERFGWGQ